MSNNCTFKFNEDGPIRVSEEDFLSYQELDLGGFAGAYKVWIDEYYTDGVRRLALRDLLRHTVDTEDESRRRYYRLAQNCHWASAKPELDSILQYRPKLAREFCQELEYCLERNLTLHRSTLDFLIEATLRVSNNNLCFWPFHSLAQDPRPHQITQLLIFCHPSNGMPKWIFRDQVWPRLKERVKEEGWLSKRSSKSFYRDKKLHAIVVPGGEETVLLALCEYVSSSFLYVEHPEDIVIAETIAEWLNELLPEQILFTPYFDHLPLGAQCFTNEELAYRILRRHLVHIPIQAENGRPTFHCEPGFFYWLKGLTLQIAPDDDAFLDKIDEFIASRDLIVG